MEAIRHGMIQNEEIGNVTYIYTNPNTTDAGNVYDFATKQPISASTTQPTPNTEKRKSKTYMAENKTTVPLKGFDSIEAVKQQLLYASPKMGLRNYIIFCLGINIGLRAGDLLTLRIGDVWNYTTNTVKPQIIIVEEKTQKPRAIIFNSTLQNDIADYIQTLSNQDTDAPLFQSRKKQVKYGQRSINRSIDDTGCLETNSYGRILRDIGKQLGMEHICTHTMRKTFGYNRYTHYTGRGELVGGQYQPIDYLQMEFGHSSTAMTLKYIGISDEIKGKVADEVLL